MARGRAGGTPATAALIAAGVPFTLHTYDHAARHSDYGREAAAALGVDGRRLFKTLVVSAGDHLAVAVVPVAGMLDLKALAAALGVKKTELADPVAAQRSSGYVVGGISPLGQRTPLATVVDASALDHDAILVSAGRRGLQVELAPADLAAVTRARFAAVAR